MFLVGCSNDEETGSAEYLVGTEWVGINDGVKVSLSFTKENGCVLKASSLTLWYDYYEKSGVIHLKPDEYGNYDFDCSINGNVMSIFNSDTKKLTYVLSKKK